MGKIAVSLKIDVSKIDKSRLFKGAKGIYLDATAFIDIDELDQYGNSGMITQDVTKEERDQGVKGNILGNSKVFWKDLQPPQYQPPQQYQGNAQGVPSFQNAGAPPIAKSVSNSGAMDSFDDDIPF